MFLQALTNAFLQHRLSLSLRVIPMPGKDDIDPFPVSGFISFLWNDAFRCGIWCNHGGVTGILLQKYKNMEKDFVVSVTILFLQGHDIKAVCCSAIRGCGAGYIKISLEKRSAYSSGWIPHDPMGLLKQHSMV